MERWTLQQFRIFEAVARHRSYTRAAEELHLTQPAVHIQVRRLEETVGLPLFETVGRRIVPTRAGEATLEAAAEVLGRLKALGGTIADLKGRVGGPLRVAVVNSGEYFLPAVLGEFLRRHPEVQPQLIVTNRARIVERLAERRDDFVVMGRTPEGMDLAAHPFMDNLLVPVAGPDHPLAAHRALPLETLAGERFLMREPGSGTRDAVERLMAEQGLSVRTTMELGSTEAIKRAVMAGLGVSVLSLSSLEPDLEAGRLTLLRVAGFPLRRTWFAVHHRGKRLGPTADAFLALLMQEGESARQRNSRLAP
ncbi:LysR family transcriptional regulator [Azospirillum halopraeferens]|uniref:LysR family transcriptional regulator n=1 Tax=Azospirillum halopraeferens TaxID=34010 RepID=UPI00040DAAFC|nr:LysR family transcriptional regulator [Azospirillum halopraeferens]